MEKQKVINGFSMIETLFVLMILCTFTIRISLSANNPSLSLFMEKLMQHCTIAQEKAYINKVVMDVNIQTHYATFGDVTFEYPNKITCTAYSFHYNSKGNINKAGSTQCSLKNNSHKLIFQLGSGRVRLE